MCKIMAPTRLQFDQHNTCLVIFTVKIIWEAKSIQSCCVLGQVQLPTGASCLMLLRKMLPEPVRSMVLVCFALGNISLFSKRQFGKTSSQKLNKILLYLVKVSSRSIHNTLYLPQQYLLDPWVFSCLLQVINEFNWLKYHL